MNMGFRKTSDSEVQTASKGKTRSSSASLTERASSISSTSSKPRISRRSTSREKNRGLPVSDKRPYVPGYEYKHSTDNTNRNPDQNLVKGCRTLPSNGDDEVRLHEPSKPEVEQDVGTRRSDFFRNYLNASANEIQRCQASLQRSFNNQTLNVNYLKYLERNQEALNKAIDNFEKRKTIARCQLEEGDSLRGSKTKFLDRLSKILFKD